MFVMGNSLFGISYGWLLGIGAFCLLAGSLILFWSRNYVKNNAEQYSQWKASLLSRFAFVMVFTLLLGIAMFIVGQKKSQETADRLLTAVESSIASGSVRLLLKDGEPHSMLSMLRRVIEEHVVYEKSREVDIRFVKNSESNGCLCAQQEIVQCLYNPSKAIQEYAIQATLSAFDPPCEKIQITSVQITDDDTKEDIDVEYTIQDYVDSDKIDTIANVTIMPGQTLRVVTKCEMMFNQVGRLSHSVRIPAERLKAHITSKPDYLDFSVEFSHPEHLTAGICTVDSSKFGGSQIDISMNSPLLPGCGFQLHWKPNGEAGVE